MKAASVVDVLIVGGGVIGLSIAYELLKSGLRVRVLDRGVGPGAASWAGAGILSAPAEHPDLTDPVACLSDLSGRTHAHWAEELRERTGLDNGYRRDGGLDLALDANMWAELEAASRYWRRVGIRHEWVQAQELWKWEPELAPLRLGGVYLPDRAQLRNPWHLRALRAACVRMGGEVLADEGLTAIHRSGERIEAVETATRRHEAGEVIVAAGAWSGVVGRLLGLSIDTEPILGQIVVVRNRPGMLTRIIEAGLRYLVPRQDGLVLIGSTEERRGFDATTTAAVVQELIAFGTSLCPALGESELVRAWAGLRPGSGDGLPYLGRVPGWRNLILATGHFRAGVQLSPGTALVVGDLVLGRAPRIAIEKLGLGSARTAERREGQPFRS